MFGLFRKKAKESERDLDRAQALKDAGQYAEAANVYIGVFERADKYAEPAAFSAAQAFISAKDFANARLWIDRAEAAGTQARFVEQTRHMITVLEEDEAEPSTIEIGQFTFAKDDVPEPALPLLHGFLDQPGREFAVDQTIEIAGSLLRVEGRADRRLTLAGPQLGTMPIQWGRSLQGCLTRLLRQRYTADSLGLTAELDFENIRAPACVLRDAAQCDHLVLRREAPEDGMSWFVLDAERAEVLPSEMEKISVWEATVRLPIFALFLGLPPGVEIHLRAGEGATIFRDGEPLSYAPDSFLGQFLAEAPLAARYRT